MRNAPGLLTVAQAAVDREPHVLLHVVRGVPNEAPQVRQSPGAEPFHQPGKCLLVSGLTPEHQDLQPQRVCAGWLLLGHASRMPP